MTGSDRSSDRKLRAFRATLFDRSTEDAESLAGLTMLVCHPEETALQAMESCCQLLNISLIKAQTGEHALYELRKTIKQGGQPDLIMLGENTGDIAPKVLIKRIRDLLELAAPIVLISEGEKEVTLAFREKEMIDNVLTFPFTDASLSEVVRETIGSFGTLQVPGNAIVNHTVRNRADGFLLPASLPGINIEKVLGALDIEFDLVKRVLRGFRENTPEILGELEQAFAHKEWQVVRERAHNIKGSAANIGAEQLQQTCRKLEFLCEKTIMESAREPRELFLVELTAAYRVLVQSIEWLLSDEVLQFQQRGSEEQKDSSR